MYNISRNIKSQQHKIYPPYNHPTKYAMHHREQLKSNHQAQQKGNKKEISKTNQENESLLTVPGERSY